jgi:hypothetical protein
MARRAIQEVAFSAGQVEDKAQPNHNETGTRLGKSIKMPTPKNPQMRRRKQKKATEPSEKKKQRGGPSGGSKKVTKNPRMCLR